MSLSVESYSNFGDLKPKLKLLIPSSIDYVIGESIMDLTIKILVICDQWRRQDFKSGGARLKNKIESKINLRNINRYY